MTEAFAFIIPSWVRCTCPSPLGHRILHSPCGDTWGTTAGGLGKGSAEAGSLEGPQLHLTCGHPGLPHTSPTHFPTGQDPPKPGHPPPPQGHSLQSLVS